MTTIVASKAACVTVKLIGRDEDGGAVRLNDFASFCRVVSRSLRIVAQATGDADAVEQRIVSMEAASATMTIDMAKPGLPEKPAIAVANLFRATVTQLRQGKNIDGRFSHDDLVSLRELSNPVLKKGLRVFIEDEPIDTQFAASVDKLLGMTIDSEGDVSGRLERVNIRGRYEFVVYPPVFTRGVVCTFSAEMFPEVQAALGRFITASGTLKFRPNREVPDRLLVKSFEVHPPNEQLPTLADVRALGPWDTGGLSSVDYVRALRDA